MIFAREKFGRKGLADDAHTRRFRAVRNSERAAFEQRNAHRPKVITADDALPCEPGIGNADGIRLPFDFVIIQAQPWAEGRQVDEGR